MRNSNFLCPITLHKFGAVLGWSTGVPQFEVMPKGRNIRQIKAEMSCLGMNGP